jgi:hypothetical protein
MPDAYVAPAARVLTVLHRPGLDDRTVCGQEMDADGLWVPVERRDGDRVCPACGELTEDGYVQEALL